jgi:hypothetical protein
MEPAISNEELPCRRVGAPDGLSDEDAEHIRAIADEFAAGLRAPASNAHAVAMFDSVRTRAAEPDRRWARQQAVSLKSMVSCGG